MNISRWVKQNEGGLSETLRSAIVGNSSRHTNGVQHHRRKARVEGTDLDFHVVEPRRRSGFGTFEYFR